jgi:DNA-binding NtrC family response regulator
MRILLVEDLEDLRILLAATLWDEGHVVIEASDFPAAVAVLAAPDTCDAVVADVRLPSGSGIALADLARQAGIPVLLCTGDPQAMSMLGEQGIRHLRKPFPLGALTDWISEVAELAAPRRNTQS